MPLFKGTTSIGTGWEDLPISGLSLPRTGAAAPSISVYRGTINLLAFSNTLVNETWTTLHIKHGYKDGTKVYPHIHWTHNNATPSGSVVWKLDYTTAKGFSEGGFSSSSTMTLQSPAGAQYAHSIVEASDVNAINTILEPDTVIVLRIYRDTADDNDTFGDDAFLVVFDAHYESDGRKTLEKRPPFNKIL